jgi:hypothetical protein
MLFRKFRLLRLQRLPLHLLGKAYVWKIGVNSLDRPVGLSISLRLQRAQTVSRLLKTGGIIVFRTSVVNAYVNRTWRYAWRAMSDRFAEPKELKRKQY